MAPEGFVDMFEGKISADFKWLQTRGLRNPISASGIIIIELRSEQRYMLSNQVHYHPQIQDTPTELKYI